MAAIATQNSNEITATAARNNDTNSYNDANSSNKQQQHTPQQRQHVNKHNSDNMTNIAKKR